MSFAERIKFVFSELFKLLLPFIKLLMTAAGKLAMELAEKYVPIAAEHLADGTWRERQDQVIKNMKDEAKLRGIYLSTTLCIDAIQAVYTRLLDEK